MTFNKVKNLNIHYITEKKLFEFLVGFNDCVQINYTY